MPHVSGGGGREAGEKDQVTALQTHEDDIYNTKKQI